jgi:uncharacterized protein DUF4333
MRVTAGLFTAFLLAGCGGDVNKDKAQDQIASGIEAQTKADVKYVKCPGGVKAEKGATFQCEALIPVNVTQVDENGHVRWQITSFSGPPGGATGAAGAAGASGATGVAGGPQGGGAATGGATGKAGGAPGAAAGGTVADDSRFERYTNRSEGYSILHPVLWKSSGGGKDVLFPFPDGSRFIHVVVGSGGLPTVPEEKKELASQTGINREVKKVSKQMISGQPAIFAEYEYKAANAPKQVVRRYVFARGTKRVLIEFGALEKLANKKPLLQKIDHSVRSFRFTGSGT